MCGIVGIVGNDFEANKTSEMLYVQKHRGPDYTEIWKDETCSLGHNRLAIIDLSKDSNQPFIDNSERYVLVYNGEIYNYLELKEELKYTYNFNTFSDTEVLIAAYLKWGKDCLHKLNGMFAFAIWDKKEKKMFAARDRFGVKPFYYTQKGSSLAFASEIKALHKLKITAKANKKVWANYFVYGSYGLPNETFYEAISQLPGGHYLEFQEENIQINKWYNFEKEIKKYTTEESFEIVKEKYTQLLTDSIRLRFRADVPVGFNLSGGLDSSTLLAFVNHVNQHKTNNIKAYTFYTDDERYDELPWVEEMISLTNNSLQKIKLSFEDVEDFSKKIAYHQDEPYGGLPTIAYANIFKKAREHGTLVLLDGQGMDEQWAGYDYYLKSNNATIQGVKKSPFRPKVLSSEVFELAEKPTYPTPFNDEILDKQYRDLFFTKIPRALRFNDRISMAHSTELREPFLDYRLVEYAFAQPLEYKIKGGIQKYLLRDIVSEYLSDSITYAPKRPLQTPQREWLGNELKDFVTNEINKIEYSDFATWFDIEQLKKEWDNYLEGDNQSSFHVWQWLNFSLLTNVYE